MSRLILHEAYHFLTCSTFEHHPFLSRDECKQAVIRQLEKCSRRFGIKISAYAVLDNHYHVLFYLQNGWDRKKVIQQINGGSAYQMNRILHRSGKIWGNYWAWYGTDQESLRNMVGYISGNPLKHGLVKSYEDLRRYRYCSYADIVAMKGEEEAQLLVSEVINLDFEKPSAKACRR